MNYFQKPIVIVSKCLEFEHCRWNGNIISSPIVKILKSHVEFRPICAEVEIELGVPRNPVRLVIEGEELKMIQPATNKDFTNKMNEFAYNFLNSLENVDGFILKAKSPSCGLYNTKYYQAATKGAPKIEEGSGLFGKKVIQMFPNIAIETEGRLTNFRIREHWLIKLFTLANWRKLKSSRSKQELINFHTKNKFLFMAYNQNRMKALGRIVANEERLNFEDLVHIYEVNLNDLLKMPPEYSSHINVLMHAFGYFKKKLTFEEKAFFLDELEKYRTGCIPLFVLQNLLNSWINRFDESYLRQQSYFKPFPEELINFDLLDTWRGRSYWI
ncbi:MAG: YbgA family protein [Promethearchaeota archaeon]